MAAPCVFASERRQRADVVLRRILMELLAVVRQHGDAVQVDGDVEALHAFRVAVRRSRVAAALLATTLPKNEIIVYRKDMKWLGEITGECRDLDVAFEKCVELVDDGVRLMLAEDRQLAHRSVVEALRSQRFARWVRDWEIYLRESPEPPNVPLIEDLAKQWMSKARGRVTNAFGGEVIDSGNLHRIRIACKKLRYDLEFFSEIDHCSGGTKAIERLKNLQDVLGAHHDAHVQKLRFAEMRNRSGIEDTVKVALEKLERVLEQTEEKLKLESLLSLTNDLQFFS